MTFDLSNLAAKTDVVSVQLKDPRKDDDELLFNDNTGEPVCLHILGKASKQYRNDMNARVNKELAKRDMKKKTNKPTVTAESLWEDGALSLIVCSQKLTGIQIDGKDINTKEQFEELYQNPSYEWLRLQAMEILDNDANFM